MHMHTHLRAHLCAQTHIHKCSLYITLHLFIYLPNLTRRKGRLRTASLNNRRTTCLNTGGVLADTILNFSLWGFLPHCKACLFFLITRLIHMRILTLRSSRALYSQANGFLSAYTRSLDTFIYSFSFGVIFIY